MAQAPSSRALFSESGNVPGELRQDTSEFNVIFVHSRLDDYGLPASVFRVYCHLARRAGSGAAFPAVASIARICRLHPQTVRQALRVLVQHRLITREPRPGTTPIYRLTPAAQWQTEPEFRQHAAFLLQHSNLVLDSVSTIRQAILSLAVLRQVAGSSLNRS